MEVVTDDADLADGRGLGLGEAAECLAGVAVEGLVVAAVFSLAVAVADCGTAADGLAAVARTV